MKVPYPPLTRSPFHKGEGKEEAASPQKRKPTPASLRSAAPSKGRGSRGCSLLPLEGGAPKGRRLDGDSGMKESEEMHLKSTINESTLSTAPRSPFPMRGRLRGAALCADFCKRRCPKVVSSHQPLETTYPCFQTTGFKGFNGFRWRLRGILDDGIPISSAFPLRGRCPEGADRAQAV